MRGMSPDQEEGSGYGYRAEGCAYDETEMMEGQTVCPERLLTRCIVVSKYRQCVMAEARTYWTRPLVRRFCMSERLS